VIEVTRGPQLEYVCILRVSPTLPLLRQDPGAPLVAIRLPLPTPPPLPFRLRYTALSSFQKAFTYFACGEVKVAPSVLPNQYTGQSCFRILHTFTAILCDWTLVSPLVAANLI
jgi:hypothetical protein